MATEKSLILMTQKGLELTPPKTILLFSVLMISIHSKSQLCSGTLGAPVTTIDFGAGPNPGTANSNISVNYQYSNQDCPAESFYALRNTTMFCFNNDWQVVAFDHTPNDPNGYFLIVNALTGPSLIFTDTIFGLCANNPVQVDAWVLNLLKPAACSGNGIDPNLTFIVTDMAGNTLGQKNTGDLVEIDQPQWTNHNFLFNAPANGTVIIKVMSNAAAGCGNEFALDDIIFRPCGPSISATFASGGTQLSFCGSSPQPIVMNSAYSGNYANPVYQWQVSSSSGASWTNIAGANATSYSTTPTTGGEYWYRCTVTDLATAANPNCTFASNTLRVSIGPPPFVQATNYVYGCYGSTVYFIAAGGTYYEWWGPNGFHSNLQQPEIPNVDYSHTGDYIVKVTTHLGCSGYDTISLTIYDAPVATLSPTSISICEGDSVQLNAGGSLRYKWSPSNGLSNDTIPNPWAKPVDDVTYMVRVYNEYTCYDTVSARVTVWKNQYFRKNKPVQLDGGASGSNITYSWSPPTYLDNPNYLKPIAKPPASMTYTLTVVSNNGCGIATDDVKLEAIDKLFIPTGFTPNNDGLNDRWEIVTFEDYEDAVAEVYNRYGQLVYRGYAKSYKPWDGTFKNKPCLPGVYVYLVNLHNGKPILKGTLNLIR
jgi:gliding motility-associated-like protein